jgi:hypothetical protein
VGAEVTHDDHAHIYLSKLPEPMRSRAKSWWGQGAEVAARLDDAGEYRIIKLRPRENPWIGWRLVFFHG